MGEFESIGLKAAALENDGDAQLDSMSVIPGSLCMACGGSGETRLMLTKIPLFREIILSSFSCGDCTERNTEVQFGGETQARGVRYRLTATRHEDRDRQVVKSESAVVRIPALDLEIPAATQRGVVTTVEGVLRRTSEELGAMQARRLVETPEVGLKIQGVIGALDAMAAGDAFPFVLEVEDAAGNSFVQPLVENDPAIEHSTYERTEADNVALGFRETGVAGVGGSEAPGAPEPKVMEGLDVALDPSNLGAEVMQFTIPCPSCGVDGEERMCTAKIPYFKECVIMAFSCAACGYKNSEVKGGGAIPLKGCVATLTCRDSGDLSRDVLKSDTAALAIPELDLELVPGSLGSIYTTVEGCLEKVAASLERGNPFSGGDAEDAATGDKFVAFIAKIRNLRDGGGFPFTMVLRDPLANSFVGPRRDAAAANASRNPLSEATDADVPTVDANLAVEDYERSWDEDEDLGLHDIDTGAGETLGTVAEDFEGGDDDAPTVDGLGGDDAPAGAAAGCADHVRPVARAPDPLVDHPNPNFAKGCQD